MLKNTDHIYSIYKEKSFSKAAEKLHISQPALSSTVRKVEKEAGELIFDRSTSPITLTPFGMQYIKAIERLRLLEKELEDYSQNTKALKKGSLSIGCSVLSVPWLETDAIASFKLKHPGVTVKVLSTSAMESKQMLDRGELDLIISESILDSKEYNVQHCYHEHLILAVPKNYPINKKFQNKALSQNERMENTDFLLDGKAINIRDFKDIPFILLSEKNYLRTCTDGIFMEASITPDITMEVEHSANALVFASYGIGATILSNRLTLDSSVTEKLCFYRIESQKPSRPAFIYYKKDSYVTSAMETFIKEFSIQTS